MGFATVVLVSALYALGEGLAVSGPAHLTLAGLLFGSPEPPAGLLALARLGAALGLLWGVRERLAAAAGAGLGALTRPSLFRLDPEARAGALLAVALCATGIVGWGMGRFGAAPSSPPLVGLGLALSGAALASTRFAEPEAPSVGFGAAVLFGVALALGGGPGASPLGAGFVILVALGWERGRAAELAVLAVGLLHLGGAAWGLARPGVVDAAPVETITALGTGMLTAAVASGYGRALLAEKRGPWLAAWLIPAGLAALLHARWVG